MEIVTADPSDKAYKEQTPYVCTFAYNFTGTSLEKLGSTEEHKGHGLVDFGSFVRQTKPEPESDTPKAAGAA